MEELDRVILGVLSRFGFRRSKYVNGIGSGVDLVTA